jgi:hypothetical protein
VGTRFGNDKSYVEPGPQGNCWNFFGPSVMVIARERGQRFCDNDSTKDSKNYLKIVLKLLKYSVTELN